MKYLSSDSPKNKRVLLRVDYNVPLENENITDDTRIKGSLPTINLLLQNNNKVIILSHIGRPKGRDASLSLEIAKNRLARLLPTNQIILIKDFQTDKQAFTNQKPNEIILLENIRFFPGEKENDTDFAKKLASLGDVFVNDAFSVCHRAAASTVGITQFLPSYCGLALEKELSFLTKLNDKLARPFVAIVGGGKISTKLMLLDSLAKKVDSILVGGGIANNLLKADGKEIGESLCETGLLPEAKQLLEKYGAKFILPVDTVVLKSDGSIAEISVDEINSDDKIEDIGQKTGSLFAEAIHKAKTIVWNGPVGEFEKAEFTQGTYAVLLAISESKALSVIGGGDTIAAISKYPELARKISFISTGGGALLEYLEKGTLPGIEALEKNSH